jgi:hypothetical protein
VVFRWRSPRQHDRDGAAAGLGTLVAVVGLPVIVATVFIARVFADVAGCVTPACCTSRAPGPTTAAPHRMPACGND